MNTSNYQSSGLFSIPPPFAFVPDGISNRIIIAIFNQVFVEAIKAGDLDFLTNNWVLIEVTDIGLSFSFSLENNKLIHNSNATRAVDLCICANSCDFLSMIARDKDPDTLFFQRKITMQGSTELGLCVKNFLDGFDVESHWFSHRIDQVLQLSYPLLSKLICKNS